MYKNRVTRFDLWNEVADGVRMDRRTMNIGYLAVCEKRCLYLTAEVERITDGAFMGRGEMEALEFEAKSRIVSIGANAFVGTRIRSVVIPASVREIGDWAFKFVPSSRVKGTEATLENLAFERGSQLISIGKEAFARTKIKSVVIPASVKVIDASAFAGCCMQTILVEPGNTVFVACDCSLLSRDRKKIICCMGKRFAIPGSVEEIGTKAFYGSCIEEICVLRHVKLVADDSFLDCRDMKRLNVENPGLIGNYFGLDFHGIIAHLTAECGGNVAENGLVNVTAKTVYCGLFRPLDFDDYALYYMSDYGSEQWFCLDFKTSRVVPTHYTIRSQYYGRSALKSWVLEASLDGADWKELDQRNDNHDLDGKGKVASFATSDSGTFRFIRLRQTGVNHDDELRFAITALEIFGTLIPTLPQK